MSTLAFRSGGVVVALTVVGAPRDVGLLVTLARRALARLPEG